MTHVLLKRRNLDTDTHTEGEHQGKMTAVIMVMWLAKEV